MNHLTANDIKVRGVSAIDSALRDQPEVFISVRGKQRYVVMEMSHYQYLRECELEAALVQSQADRTEGRFVQESAQEHMQRIEQLLQQSLPNPTEL